MNSEVTILYRPVGPEELDRFAASGFRGFPPRLPAQPIFYPVLTEDYPISDRALAHHLGIDPN